MKQFWDWIYGLSDAVFFIVYFAVMASAIFVSLALSAAFTEAVPFIVQ